MDFHEYQKKAAKTAIYPVVTIKHPEEEQTQEAGFVYPALGLAGETGEVSEKLKKILRDDFGIITQEKRKELSKELGDCLWYLSALCTELKLDLNEVAEDNIRKLQSRQQRDLLHGEGDNR